MGETAEILAKEGHDHARDAGPVRPPVAPAGDRGAGASSPRRSCRCRSRRTSTASLTLDNGVRENQTMEALAKLKPVLRPEVRHGHGRQLVADHGRRRGGRRRLGGVRREARAEAARPRRRLGLRRPRARADGPRAVALDAARPEEGRPLDEGHRPRRDERGVRGAGPREPQGVRAVDRSSARSPKTS